LVCKIMKLILHFYEFILPKEYVSVLKGWLEPKA
jgi:hypothetical protein